MIYIIPFYGCVCIYVYKCAWVWLCLYIYIYKTKLNFYYKIITLATRKAKLRSSRQLKNTHADSSTVGNYLLSNEWTWNILKTTDLWFYFLYVWYCGFVIFHSKISKVLWVSLQHGISYIHSIRIDIFILENFFLGKKQKCLFLNLYDIKEESHWHVQLLLIVSLWGKVQRSLWAHSDKL